jgi:hypothetical protein
MKFRLGVVDVYRMRLTPSLTLSTLGAQRRDPAGGGAPPSVSFDFGVFAGLNHVIAADSGNSSTLEDRTPFVNAGAQFKLEVLPQRPWGFDMYGDILRTVEPNNGPAGEGEDFDRDSMRLGAGVNWRPGGGLFDWRLGYEIQYHLFEQASFEAFNNARHFIKTRGRWRFLPRTALLYDASYGFVRYSNTTSGNDGETLESRIGINGLITYHFALLAMAGWSSSFYDASSNGAIARNHDSIVAHAELKWFLMPAPSLEAASAPVGLSSIALGYTRNFNVSYLGSFYQRDRGYLNFSYFIGGVAVIGVEGGLSHYSYPEFNTGAGSATQPGFSEDRIDAQLFAEYRFSDTFGLNTTLRYDQAITEDRPNNENLEFTRYQAFIGARFFW